MTDYDRDLGPYKPREPYNPDPSFDEIERFQELNDFIFTDAEAIDLMVRDRIRGDLRVGRTGLSTGVLYDILEYMNEQLCYK